MTSLQVEPRDNLAQRAIMMSLLDAFADRLTGWPLELLATASHARQECEQVRSAMPQAVADVLMPMADRAIAALVQVQDGFFIQRQKQDTAVHLVKSDGTGQWMQADIAAARLIKIYRNATHGFGGKGSQASKEQKELDASILLYHEGKLPGDLVYLPYLYLLSVLCNPGRIQAKIAKSCSQS